MGDINPVALVVAVLGAGGLGVFVRDLASLVTRWRNGMSARESKRSNDIIAQRDYQYLRAERESRDRRRLQEYASRLRRLVIDIGFEERLNDYPWPNIEADQATNGYPRLTVLEDDSENEPDPR